MTSAIPAPYREATLEIEGMTCASCVARVEKRLEKVEGVSASVNLATESARVQVSADVDDARLVAAVAEAGYTARVRPVPHASSADSHLHDERGTGDAHGPHDSDEQGGHQHDAEDIPGHTRLATRLIVSAALALPVVVLGMVPAWQFAGWQWVSLVLATPIVFWGGWPFHRAAFAAARHGAATMDTLITLGTMAAYLWSVWALFFGNAGQIGLRHDVVLFGPVHDSTALVYFEVAAAVTVFLLLGRYIEQRSRRRAGAALRSLMDLGAKDVELESGRRIPVDRLRVDDTFIVRPGETIATDGIVAEGRAAVDASMLTGESVPIEVGTGGEVTGGTVAVDGRLLVRAVSVGADTRLAHIARLVEDAQAGKSRVQRLADRISGIFVPIVVVLAILTLLAWVALGQPLASGFTAAVAVLIIACPCALGLATPVAILVGTGRGAQLGVLITGPEAIESANRIDTVLIDKTGTLTTGAMTVREVVVARDDRRGDVLRVASALEGRSEHPIARAIASFGVSSGAATTAVAVDDFRSHAGRGVTGIVDGVHAFAGSPAFAVEQVAALPADLERALERADGSSLVVVGWADASGAPVARAVFAVGDDVREGASAAVASLREQGIDVVLLTGDGTGAARAVAARVGIDEVVAGVLPEGKLAEVERRRAAGRRVAMVGDGVNDAAALAAADLGIAMGGGTDAAMHASDITLVRNDPESIVTALRLARRTMRTIRGNLFWAFGYNVAAIPLAASGLLNPMIAGLAMAFSSVFVVLNSLRLRSVR
ncbi:heavy metal translocating P-type ATPase [Microbacterium lacus]|uniref:heavy metal translocating P-type ATPase n=1 Tax=Microbacterium lacus TaxID=415217 RepID=UPI000C2C6806|nr:heavy metal translocating P-type ATPase [Microbacterium lacus]